MKNGFTLAELLITIGILGVVIALLLPTLVDKCKNPQKYTKSVKQIERVKYDYNFTE